MNIIRPRPSLCCRRTDVYKVRAATITQQGGLCTISIIPKKGTYADDIPPSLRMSGQSWTILQVLWVQASVTSRKLFSLSICWARMPCGCRLPTPEG